MASIESIASPDLIVLTAETGREEFRRAIESRSFISNLPAFAEETLFPDAILQAKTASAVQTAVQYCASHNLQICARSGGHSWESIWLQGRGTVLLDVGDLNHISFHPSKSTVTVGPGAKGDAIFEAIPDDVFFPCGHSQRVPVGGFILGGGMGLGFPKYGMTSMLVEEVEVVLGDGTILTAKEGSDDPRQKAVLQLIKGSYSSFPGIITSFTLGPLPPKPRGVMKGTILYDMENWKKAIDLGIQIATSEESGAEAIETLVILTYAPPAVAESTGVAMVAMVSVTIFADIPEEGLSLWNTYTENVSDTLLPLEKPEHVSPEDLSKMNSDIYPPSARFKSQGFNGNGAIRRLPRTELKAALEPVTDMWMSDDKPPAPSHTLLQFVPPDLKQRKHQGRDLAIGFTLDFQVLSYAIYQDPHKDYHYQELLERASVALANHPNFKTCLAEGRIRTLGIPSGYTDRGFDQTKKMISFLDPKRIFGGFPPTNDHSVLRHEPR